MNENFVKTIIMLAFISIFSGCASTPVTTFNGNPRDSKDVATLTYWGTMGAPKLTVYKVDGKTSDKYGTRARSYTTMRVRWYGGINYGVNLQLLPGKHELELCFGETEEVKIISYNFKSGSNYKFIFEDKKFSLVEEIDGNQVPVNFQLRDAPVYKEPGEKEPHSILLWEKGITFYRIDGFHGNSWEEMWNDNFFPEKEIFLKPGLHTIEYCGRTGTKSMIHIGSLKYSFNAGKKYKINILDITDEVKELEDNKDSVGMMRAEVVEVE